MKILFTFENPLPAPEADAEVFTSTAKYLRPLVPHAALHAPMLSDAALQQTETFLAMRVIRAYAPARPAVLRHLCCGLSMICRREFRQADLIYTRNLYICWLAILFGQKVVYDHYRPWPAQIPPLQFWIYRLMCNPRFVMNICHSDYARAEYLKLGIPPDKLRRIRNGFEPERMRRGLPRDAAKQRIGVPVGMKTVVYTGRINHKKGLSLVIEAARRLPDYLFILVGSYGPGPIEAEAAAVSNAQIVPWQAPETLIHYISAADILLIPPSLHPLEEFGSTVLPLKLFLYLAAGRPILAGDAPDVREVLRDGYNAVLCRPDSLNDLVDAIDLLIKDEALAARIAAQALEDSRSLTWDHRARAIAEAVQAALQPIPARRGSWSRGTSMIWMRQSCRWLLHLIHGRSWILPPSAP